MYVICDFRRTKTSPLCQMVNTGFFLRELVAALEQSTEGRGRDNTSDTPLDSQRPLNQR